MPRNMRQLIATVRSLLHRPPYVTVLKWNPNQARGPKGSPTGGQWVKGGGNASMYGTRILPSSTEIDQMPPGTPKVVARGRHAGRVGRQERERREEREAAEAVAYRQGGGVAGYATILNASMGTGFKNRPRAAGFDPAEAAPPPKDPVNKNVLEALTNGEVKRVVNGLNDGVNVSVKVEMDDANGTKAVFKPERGEMWGSGFANGDIEDKIVNKDLSLAEREAMASEVDRALGLGLVPTTVLRTSLDVEGMDTSSEDDVVWDSYELREMYNEYRDKAQEDAMDAVGGEMADLYQEAQTDHVKDIENRAQEVMDIWNEEVKDFPDEGPYGAVEELQRHPNLPMGSAQSFRRQEPQEKALNPLEVLDEAGVDVSAGLSNQEKDRVRAVIRQRLEEGYQELGDVSRQEARDHLDYDKWMEEHQDTEGRLYESKVKTFDSWAEANGYNQGSGGGDRGNRNDEAPHPNGGSLQHFISGLDGYGSPSTDDITKLAVLDYVIGSMDRHGGNLMYHGDAPVAIDNGYSMPDTGRQDEPDDFTFRSRAVRDWRDGGRGVDGFSEDQRRPILQALEATNWKALADRHPNMSRGERDAFLGRVERMREALQTELGLYRLWKQQDLMG
jgi:hypothetical protein